MASTTLMPLEEYLKTIDERVAVQRRDIALSESYAQTPLVLAIEILSPGDKLGATFAKCELYHQWGVPDCWMVDPDKRRAWVYRSGDEPRLVEDALEAGEIRFLRRPVSKRVGVIRNCGRCSTVQIPERAQLAGTAGQQPRLSRT